MQECETGTGKSSVKRVTVRSGGAGHAHSGVVKADGCGCVAATAAQGRGRKTANIMIVRLGG
jgi:hypothetical protein